jgi:hypothetical protein
MTYGQLNTGDVVKLAGTQAVVMATQPHPVNFGFLLIVWWIPAEKRITFDCLSPHYELISGSTVVYDGLVSWQLGVNELAAPRT